MKPRANDQISVTVEIDHVSVNVSLYWDEDERGAGWRVDDHDGEGPLDDRRIESLAIEKADREYRDALCERDYYNDAD